MFGVVLGALGPAGWALGAALTVAGVAAATSSSSGSSRHTNGDEVRRGYEEEKQKKLEADLDKYIQKETNKINNNYNTIIKLDSNDKIKITRTDQTLNMHIKSIEKDIISMEKTINLLKELQSSNTKSAIEA